MKPKSDCTVKPGTWGAAGYTGKSVLQRKITAGIQKRKWSKAKGNGALTAEIERRTKTGREKRMQRDGGGGDWPPQSRNERWYWVKGSTNLQNQRGQHCHVQHVQSAVFWFVQRCCSWFDIMKSMALRYCVINRQREWEHLSPRGRVNSNVVASSIS